MTVYAVGGNAVEGVTAESGDVTITQNMILCESSAYSVVPKELPVPCSIFDRDKEHTRFKESVDRGSNVVFLFGLPSAGTTTCLISWANKLKQSYPDGQVFIEARHYRNADGAIRPGALKERVLRSCCPAAAPCYSEEELSARYRSAVADKSILIVIDDVIDWKEIEELLPNSSTSLVLGAGKIRLPNTRYNEVRIEIKEFDFDTSVAFLQGVLNEHDSEVKWEDMDYNYVSKIASYSEGFPIVLARAAQMLVEQTESPEAILSKLSKKPGLSGLDDLLESYVKELSEPARFLLGMIGTIGSLDIWAEPLYQVYASFYKEGLNDAIDSLVRRRFIERVGDSSVLGRRGERIVVQRLVMPIALACVNHSDPRLSQFVKQYVACYRDWIEVADCAQSPDRLRIIESTRDVSSLFIDDEAANGVYINHMFDFYDSVFIAVNYHHFEDAVAMAEGLWAFSYENGMLRNALPAFERGLDAARLLGNMDASARMLAMISRSNLLLGNVEEADKYIEDARKAVSSSTNYMLRGSIREFSASAKRAAGNYEAAIEDYRCAIEEYQNDEKDSGRGIVISRLGMACSYLLLGKPSCSLRVLDDLNRDAPKSLDTVTRVKCDICKSEALDAMGYKEEALLLLLPTIEVCRKNQLGVRGGGASELAASIYYSLGDLGKSHELYNLASDFYEQSGLEEKAVAAQKHTEQPHL